MSSTAQFSKIHKEQGDSDSENEGKSLREITSKLSSIKQEYKILKNESSSNLDELSVDVTLKN